LESTDAVNVRGCMIPQPYCFRYKTTPVTSLHASTVALDSSVPDVGSEVMALYPSTDSLYKATVESSVVDLEEPDLRKKLGSTSSPVMQTAVLALSKQPCVVVTFEGDGGRRTVVPVRRMYAVAAEGGGGSSSSSSSSTSAGGADGDSDMDIDGASDMDMEGDSMDTTTVVAEGSRTTTTTTTTTTTSTPSGTVACATMITRGMEIEMPSGTWSPW
jgi:hypothetical protein